MMDLASAGMILLMPKGPSTTRRRTSPRELQPIGFANHPLTGSINPLTPYLSAIIPAYLFKKRKGKMLG